MKKICFVRSDCIGSRRSCSGASLPVGASAKSDGFPTGTYNTTITAEDVAKYGLPSILSLSSWIGVLENDSSARMDDLKFVNTDHGTIRCSGRLFCKPDSAHLRQRTRANWRVTRPAYAVYKWSVSGNTLTLTAASEHSERCWGRYIVSTSHPLVKIEP
jgi:hypothetical protein